MTTKIEAGPELDRAVAEAIGWTRMVVKGQPDRLVGFFEVIPQEAVEVGPYDPAVTDKLISPYSTDLNAAFAAAEKVGLFDIGYQLGKWNRKTSWVVQDGCPELKEPDIIGYGDTPALALCAAILKLKGSIMTRRTDGHCIQYAFVGWKGTDLVLDTDRLTDEEVRDVVRCRFDFSNGSGPVDRYNRCPECEVLTKVGKRLRREIECPAVIERLGVASDPTKSDSL